MSKQEKIGDVIDGSFFSFEGTGRGGDGFIALVVSSQLNKTLKLLSLKLYKIRIRFF